MKRHPSIRRRRSAEAAAVPNQKLLFLGGILLLAILVFLYLVFFTNLFRKDPNLTRLDITNNECLYRRRIGTLLSRGLDPAPHQSGREPHLGLQILLR